MSFDCGWCVLPKANSCTELLLKGIKSRNRSRICLLCTSSHLCAAAPSDGVLSFLSAAGCFARGVPKLKVWRRHVVLGFCMRWDVGLGFGRSPRYWMTMTTSQVMRDCSSAYNPTFGGDGVARIRVISSLSGCFWSDINGVCAIYVCVEEIFSSLIFLSFDYGYAVTVRTRCGFPQRHIWA